MARARRFVAECGFAVAAVDVPGHGDRPLFDALASAEKTLHANPGKHGEVPAFEVDSTLRFFARHLG